MKLVMCVCVLLVAVECKPIKRADAPPVTASEGNSFGRVDTTYTVTLVTDTGSGSGSTSGEEKMQPDFENVSLTDFTYMFYKMFGVSPEEWLRKQRSLDEK